MKIKIQKPHPPKKKQIKFPCLMIYTPTQNIYLLTKHPYKIETVNYQNLSNITDVTRHGLIGSISDKYEEFEGVITMEN